MTKPQLIIAFAVVAVWMASICVRILRPGAAYDFAALDGVILIIIGAMFSSNAIRRKNGNSGNGNGNGK